MDGKKQKAPPLVLMNQGSQNKIPCSVSMLTLNGERDLPACLESLKDFAEIIVCDGNSTDRTRDIADAAGATVIRQYDTDEPNTPCVMDKAAVRERAMAASTYPWRFFMDADDTLSPEAVEEIRSIVEDKNPHHLVWRMPTRIFIEGEEIMHEASYPSYQTRLVHEKVGAHFKGLVHERLVFDAHQFPLGTMQSLYRFGWSRERVANYWKYLSTYAKRELSVLTFDSLGSYVRWGFWYRLRVILGYTLWRIPSMYIRFGTRDTMPLSIEMTIVRYHVALLWGSFGRYITTRVWIVILVETLRGKDLNRILGNLEARNWEAYGRVFDVGGGHGGASYWRFMKINRWHRAVTVDIDAHTKPDVVLNLEHDPIPFNAGYFNTALMCNVLEHLHDREGVVKKVAGALAPGGKLYGIVPFLVGVHPDPHDFVRLSRQSIEGMLTAGGFSDVRVSPIGRGPLTASYYQSEFLIPRVLKLIILPCVLLLDSVILALRPHFREKFPLSYAFVATRVG